MSADNILDKICQVHKCLDEIEKMYLEKNNTFVSPQFSVNALIAAEKLRAAADEAAEAIRGG